MPNASLTPAQREAYALAPAKEITWDTIEVSHPSVSTSFFLVKDRKPHFFTLEDGRQMMFSPMAMALTKPQITDNGLSELTITLDNTDRAIGDFIEQVKNTNTPIDIYYRPYLESDPTTPQLNPALHLILTDISITNVISGKATFADILNKPFPNELYTRREFPSLAN